MVDALRRDLRSAIRVLASRPGWTAAAILCLAIATGANTAAFTLLNGLLLKPLPFDEPNQLVMVGLREPAATSPRPFALREYRELARQSARPTMLLARTFFPLSLAADAGARMAQAELVSGNYFQTLARSTPILRSSIFGPLTTCSINAPASDGFQRRRSRPSAQSAFC